jgi:DNA-binding NarL/FixJ family response regulator
MTVADRPDRAQPGPHGQPSGSDHGNMTAVSIRVFLLDDHELVRTGLRALLDAEDDMVVVGEAGTAEQGLREIGATQPDVAILDVRLPDSNGIEVCREVQSLYPKIRCLMLTSYSDDDALYASIMAGAYGYVLKEVGGRDLLGDIRRVSRGVSLLDRTLTEELFARLRQDHEAESRLTILTPQERKVLELIAHGQSNRQIAEELFLAEATVKNYVSSLLSKLGMRRRTEAAVYAAVLAERKAISPNG